MCGMIVGWLVLITYESPTIQLLLLLWLYVMRGEHCSLVEGLCSSKKNRISPGIDADSDFYLMDGDN